MITAQRPVDEDDIFVEWLRDCGSDWLGASCGSQGSIKRLSSAKGGRLTVHPGPPSVVPMYGSHNACVSAELFAERFSQGFRGLISASASLGGKVLRAYGQGTVGVALVYGVRWRIIAGCKRMIQIR
jgi:hypothetical protein